MKFNYKLMLLSLAALSLGACSDDIGTGSGPDAATEEGDIRYIRTTIALPSANGGRSATDEPGDNDGLTNSDGKYNDEGDGPDYEYGHDYENDVRSMILVIATEDDKYISHLVLTGLTEASNSGAAHTFTATAKIPTATLEKAYGANGLITPVTDEGQPAPKIHLYAYCNFTQNLYNQFENIKDDMGNTDWIDFHGSVEEKASMAGETPVSTASIWSKRSFLMTNAEVYTADFPRTMDDWDEYADSNNPLVLTNRKQNSGGQQVDISDPINVERVSARIDFRDASDNHDQVYPIKIDIGMLNGSGALSGVINLDEPSDDERYKKLFSVKLERMVLVNMSKDFYYLRRVSNDGTLTKTTDNGYAVGGRERRQNYVVDFSAEEKKDGTITPENANKYFNFPLYDETGSLSEIQEQVPYNNVGSTYGWYVKDISGSSNSVLSGEKDNWGGTYGGGSGSYESNSGYHIWRYVTENTLPGIESQKTVQSTGIIFKASIHPGVDIDVKRDGGTADDDTEDSERYVTKQVKETLESIYSEEGQKKEPTEYPALYSFHSMLYAGVSDIVAAAHRDGVGGSLYYAVDRILNRWYLQVDQSELEDQLGEGGPSLMADTKRIFEYKGENFKLTDGKAEDGKYYLQLNVVIADEILNDFRPEDGTKDYSKSYSQENGSEEYDINFQRVFAPEDTEEENSYKLKGFSNSQFMECCPNQDITVFIPTNDDNEGLGYYCYYFYWNRHNDNNLNGKMGEMEFATVRNNIYKLAVKDITKIGHPRDVDRDPDPIKPDDPDEDEENSIRISVEVKPWVVRVNNIEFE